MWELAKPFKDTNQGESLGFGSAIPVYMFLTNIGVYQFLTNCYGDRVRWEIYDSFVHNEL